MRTIKNKLTLTKSKVIRLYNLIKKDIDFQSEIVNSKELKELQIITEIKEDLEDIIYSIINVIPSTAKIIKSCDTYKGFE